MGNRIKIIVEVNLDDVPGAFHTPENATAIVGAILKSQISHYNPTATLAE